MVLCSKDVRVGGEGHGSGKRSFMIALLTRGLVLLSRAVHVRNDVEDGAPW
jgi:hypothetical protein